MPADMRRNAAAALIFGKGAYRFSNNGCSFRVCTASFFINFDSASRPFWGAIFGPLMRLTVKLLFIEKINLQCEFGVIKFIASNEYVFTIRRNSHSYE